MKITVTGNRLDVCEIEELNAALAIEFRKEIMKKIPAFPGEIVIDLGRTRFVDSSGLGALFAVFKAARKLNPKTQLKIINPKPHIVQLFELTQLHQLFEIIVNKSSKSKPFSPSPM